MALLPANLPSLPPPSESEILFAKRIAALWNDRDAEIVISQSHHFFQCYPSSIFKDALLGIVAESYREKGNYAKALESLDAIQSEEYKRKNFDARIDLLRKMDRYPQILQELLAKIPSEDIQPIERDEQFYTLCYADELRSLAKKSDDLDLKEEYLNTASKRYEVLKNTPFSCQAREGLAAIFTMQGRNREGAELYLALAEEFPEKWDHYYCQAAKLQIAYDPEEAFTSVQKITDLSLQKQGDQLFQVAKLLYDLKKYQYLIDRKEGFKKAELYEYRPLVDYFFGMSYFHTGNYQSASSTLSSIAYAFFPGLSTDSIRKNILLHLIAVEFQLCHPEKAEEYITYYRRQFSDDSGIAYTFLTKGIYLLQNDRAEEALAVFEEGINSFPNTPEIKRISYQKNLALMKLEAWMPARASIIEFAQAYPNDPLSLEFLKNILLCTQRLIAQAKEREEPTKNLFGQLVEDLQLLMDTRGALAEEQKPAAVIEQISAYLSMEEPQKALTLAEQFLEKYPQNPERYQVHLLMAMALEENKPLYIKHLEEALALKCDMRQAPFLHIKVFKAYLDIIQNKGESEENDLFEQACNHLYSAFSLSEEALPKESRSWLANTFTKKLESRAVGQTYVPLLAEEDLLTAEKAVKLYHSVGPNDSSTVTNLTKCYLWLGCPSQAYEILKSVEQKEADLTWNNPICHYLKGQIFQFNGDKAAALEQYKKVGTAPAMPQIVGLSASLNTARMTLSLAQEDPFMCGQAFKILTQLQAQKKLTTEPIHLEAALDYCFQQTNQLPLEERDQALLHLLRKLKSDFMNTDDINSLDYHAAMECYPEKEALYNNYMLLIDSYIHLIEAASCSSYMEQKVKNEVVENLLQTITRSKTGITLYLQNHITKVTERLHIK